MQSDSSLSVTAREILAYLTEQPAAQDTIDGISQWWSSRGTAERNRAVIEKALTELVREGAVLEINAQDAQPLYRLVRRKKRN